MKRIKTGRNSFANLFTITAIADESLLIGISMSWFASAVTFLSANIFLFANTNTFLFICTSTFPIYGMSPSIYIITSLLTDTNISLTTYTNMFLFARIVIFLFVDTGINTFLSASSSIFPFAGISIFISADIFGSGGSASVSLFQFTSFYISQ